MSQTTHQDDLDTLTANATAYLRDLVAIPSVNPGLVTGGDGEAEIARYICDRMASWGLDVRDVELAPGRHNAIGIFRGAGGGRTLLFNGHMDTVGVEGMAAPFGGEVRDGKLYGRGAIDMKASLAATLAATEAIARWGEPRRGSVIFTFVADEEYTSLGTEAVVRDIEAGLRPRPDGAINTEPSDVRICIGHRGYIWAEIETTGRAAHGSRPDLGVDAIVHMGRVLGEIASLSGSLAAGKPHPLLGTGSIHASLIEGGRELSTYPDHCRLLVERRTVPPETSGDVAAELNAILAQLAQADPNFAGTSRVTYVRDPWQADPNSEIVRLLGESVAAVTGHPPVTMAHTAWLDASLLGAAGIPTVVLGPAGDGLHAASEWVDLASVGACAAIYLDLIERFCQ